MPFAKANGIAVEGPRDGRVWHERLREFSPRAVSCECLAKFIFTGSEGSFDSVDAALRGAFTSLRMTKWKRRTIFGAQRALLPDSC